jgi:hypothetical protein
VKAAIHDYKGMKLRFTIRDLLWLTLVVAMGVGWWIDSRRSNFVQTAIIEPIRLNAEGLEMLYEAFGGREHVYIAFNSHSNCLIIVAPPDQILQIQETVQSLELRGG